MGHHWVAHKSPVVVGGLRKFPVNYKLQTASQTLYQMIKLNKGSKFYTYVEDQFGR